MSRSPLINVAAGIQAVVGLLFALSPYLLGFNTVIHAEMMALFLGIFVMVFGLMRIAFNEAVWLSWNAGAAGTLALFFPWIAHLVGGAATAFVSAGLLILICALVATFVPRPRPEEQGHH